MARFETLSPDQMTSEQMSVCDNLIASRGSVRGPFPVMLHNPGLAAAAEKLGGYARFKSKIEPRLLEFAVSVIARFWGAHVEWVAHSRLAQEAGMDPAILKAVEDGSRPDFINDDEEAVYAFLTSLLNTTKVDDPTYDRCMAALGERGMVDLMAANTHYTVVSMTLNSFRVPVPEGRETPPFGPGR
jgi:4-carboxymuconolactone decarboxylase